MNVTDIRSVAPGSTVWDRGERGSVKGLHLRSLPSGRKVFYLYYRSKSGLQRRPKLGDIVDLSLADARRRAKSILEKVAAGQDPKADWDEARKEMSVAELYERVRNDVWSKERFKKSGHASEVKSKWTTHLLPAFGSLRLSEVKPTTVREWHLSLSETPYAANRALSILSRLFNYAEELELRPQGTNPCKYVKKFAEKQRKRYATEKEAKRIFAILEREEKENPIAVAHLKLLIYTGSRPRAIERARREDLQTLFMNGEKYGILTFSGKSTEKTGEEEVVIFPPQAMAVIDKLPVILGGTLTGIRRPRKLWAKIKTEAGIEDLWVRDFRRFFATVGMSNGVNPGQITELLNHHSAQTTKRYAKLMHNPRVLAAMQIASKIDSIVAGPVAEGMVN